MAPSHRFKNQSLRLLRWDDMLLLSQNRDKYIENIENYSRLPFQADGKPGNGWVIPFVTGHKHKISWGNVGLDFDAMTIGISERWEPTDGHLYFVHNYTDVRAKMDVTFNGNVMENDTIPF